MSKSPKTRKTSPIAATAKRAPTRKPAKTARRSATSGKGAIPSRRRGNGMRRDAKASIREGTKQALLINLLSRANGASVPEMAAKAGWQHHSVRGFLSGTVKKKLGIAIASETVGGRGRVYRIGQSG